MNSNILVKGIEIIGVLFAAFGGFLAGIAPPQAADAKFAVGISSFLGLIILFTITALTKKKHQKAWIITAVTLFTVAVAAAYYYKTNLDALTFEYPPGSTTVEHIAGTQLTPAAREYKEQHEGISNAQLLARFGGLPNKSKVWVEESINSARTKLIASYVVLVLGIAAAIFSLTEGALRNTLLAKSDRVGERQPPLRTARRPQPAADDAKSSNSQEPHNGAGGSNGGRARQ